MQQLLLPQTCGPAKDLLVKLLNKPERPRPTYRQATNNRIDKLTVNRRRAVDVRDIEPGHNRTIDKPHSEKAGKVVW